LTTPSTPLGERDSPYTLLYIFGSGRSGSTLVSMLLGAHPQVLALGELSTLVTRVDPTAGTLPNGQSFRPEVRRFWQRVRECYEATGHAWAAVDLTHPRLRQAVRWSPAQIDAWARRTELIIDCARQHAPRSVVADSTKEPARVVLLARSGLFRLRVLHLMRDGRAVAQSYVRRWNRFGAGVRNWMLASMTAPALRRQVGRDCWMRLRYEDFARDPIAALARVCAFVGLEYDPVMLKFHGYPYLGLRGNPNTLAGTEEAIRLDERWRTELTPTRRVAFNLVGGWLNKLYGY
jgi:hypothetical protein